MLFDLGNTDSEEEEEEDDEDNEDEERRDNRISAHLPSYNPSGMQHVIHVRVNRTGLFKGSKIQFARFFVQNFTSI